MQNRVNVLIAAVAVLHLYFLILEMFLWTRPIGLEIFNQTAERARATASLAANQGLYNGFLAAGLFWSFSFSDPKISTQIQIFFLICISIAGIFGAWTANKKIFFIQALPALIAVWCILFR
jgi:putative membrane protein